MHKMKAIICTKYGPPEVLQIQEYKKPTPKDNEVLIKIFASSVSAADYRVRSLNFPIFFRLAIRLFLGFKKPRNSILGMELSGKIESVGKDVTLFKKGDSVFAATLQTFGAYAEYKCLPEKGPITLMPKNVSYDEAAAIPIGARTAYHYLKKIGNIKSNQHVLIYGASGSVGTYAVQLAKYFGAHVTGVCSKKNIELVKSLGADRVIDYGEYNFIKKLKTYDIIFVTIDKIPFKVCLKALNKNGIYLNIGRPLPSFSMIWASISGSKKIVVAENSPETVDALNFLKKIIEEGELRVVIDRKYSINQIIDAHRYADKGHKKGNIVIKIVES
jgi:NADPH:quinone reductase-like Zn-dependent oxidoreductase